MGWILNVFLKRGIIIYMESVETIKNQLHLLQIVLFVLVVQNRFSFLWHNRSPWEQYDLLKTLGPLINSFTSL